MWRFSSISQVCEDFGGKSTKVLSAVCSSSWMFVRSVSTITSSLFLPASCSLRTQSAFKRIAQEKKILKWGAPSQRPQGSVRKKGLLLASFSKNDMNTVCVDPEYIPPFEYVNFTSRLWHTAQLNVFSENYGEFKNSPTYFSWYTNHLCLKSYSEMNPCLINCHNFLSTFFSVA